MSSNKQNTAVDLPFKYPKLPAQEEGEDLEEKVLRAGMSFMQVCVHIYMKGCCLLVQACVYMCLH